MLERTTLHLKRGHMSRKPGPARMCVSFLVSFCVQIRELFDTPAYLGTVSARVSCSSMKEHLINPNLRG